MGLERLNQINFIDNKEVGEIQSPIVGLNNNNQSPLNEDGLSNDFISNIANITLGGTSYNKKEYDKYAEYKTYLNENKTQEELDKERANNQSNWEKFGRSFGQILENELVLGSLKGFGDIFDAFANIGNEYNDYNSEYTAALQNAIDKNKERLEIYRQNPNKSFDWGDFGWWADNFVTVGTTLSLLIPSMTITAGVGKIGKLLSLDSKVNRLLTAGAKFAKVKRPNYIAKGIQNFGKTTFTASMSRIAESYQEAQQTYKQIKEETLEALNNYTEEDYKRFNELYPEYAGLSNEEIAEKIASKGSNKTFTKDMYLIGFDILQYHTLAKMMKGSKLSAYGKIKNQIAERNNKLLLAGATEKDLESLSFSHITKEVLKDGITHPFRVLKSIPFNEGVEEIYQGINAGRGQDLAKMIVQKGYQAKFLDSYLRDPEIWEQGFWGLMGGIVFQGAGKGVGAIKNKIETKIANKDVVDDVKRVYTNFDDKTHASITSRFDKMQKLIEELTEIDVDNVAPEGYSNRYELDADGKIKTDSAGVPIVRRLTEEEKENLKGEIIKDFLNDFVMDALDAGTYESAKDFMKDPNFVKYFTDKGVTDQQLISFTGETVDAYTEQVRDTYEEYSNKVLDSKRNLNPYAAMGVARELTRREMTSYNMQQRAKATGIKLSENAEYRKLDNAEDIEDYVRLDMLRDGLIDLEKEGIMLDAMYEQGHISKVAYNNYKKELQEKKVAYINSLNSVNDKIDFKKSIISLMKEVNDRFAKDKNVEVYDSSVNNILQALEQHIDAYFKNSEDIGKTHISESLKKDIYSKTYNEFNAEYIKQRLPKSKEDFIKEYDEMFDAISQHHKDKEDKALELVSNYLSKAENTQQAWEDIMHDNITDKKLKDALQILNLGHNSTYASFIALKKLKDDIINKKKKESTTATIEGKPVEGKKAEDTNAELEKSRDDAENNKPSNNKDDEVKPPVKDDITTTPSTDIIDDIGEVEIEENNPPIDEASEDYIRKQTEAAAEEASRIEAQAKDSYVYDDPLVSTEDLISRAIFERVNDKVVQQLFRKINNIDDAAFKELFNIFKDAADDINHGEISDERVNKIIFDFIKSILIYKTRRESNSRLENLLEQLKAGGTIEINGENVVFTRFNSAAEAYGLIEAILDEYAASSNMMYKGKKVIKLDLLFDYIINNNDISYSNARTIFAYIKQYLDNNKIDKYVISSEYANKSVDELIRTLDFKKKQGKTISEYLHISPSNNTDGNVTKDLLEKHRLDKEKYPIVIVPTNNALSFRINNVEIGYLSLAESITDVNNNGYLQQRNRFGLFNVVRKENDGTISSIFDGWLAPLAAIQSNIEELRKIYAKNGETLSIDEAIKQIVFDDSIFTKNNVTRLGTKEDFIELYKLLEKANGYNGIYNNKKLLKELQNNKIFATLIKDNGLKINNKNELVSDGTTNAYSLFRFRKTGKQYSGGKYDIESFTEKDYDIITARLINEINSIVFNEYSYDKWKTNIYNNLSKTIEIQNEIDKIYHKNNEGEYVLNENANENVVANLIMDRVEVVNPGHTSIGQLSKENGGHMTAKDNPLVFIAGASTEGIIEGRSGYTNPTGFPIGTIGVLTHVANGYPIIAPIYETNKIYDENRKNNSLFGIAVRNEIIGAIDDWRAGKITLTELSEVFNNIGNSRKSPFGYGIATKVNGKGTILNVYRITSKSEREKGLSDVVPLITLYNEDKKGDNCTSIIIHNARKDGKNIAFYNAVLNDKYETNHNYEKSPSEILANYVLNYIKYSTSFFAVKNADKQIVNDNPYFQKEEGKYRVHFPKRGSIGVELNESYDSYTDFYMKNDAAIVNTSWNEDMKSYTKVGDDWTTAGIYVSTSMQKITNFVDSALSERGVDVATLREQLEQLKDGQKINVLDLLKQMNTDEGIIKSLQSAGVALLPTQISYNATRNDDVLAATTKNGVFITRNGIEDILNAPDPIQTTFRILLHEKLHQNLRATNANKFTDEQRNDLRDTYNQFVKAVNSTEFKKKCDPEQYNILKNVVDTLQQIYEPMLSDANRYDEFLEEWLVDSMTIPQVIEAMSIIEYQGTIKETTKKTKIQTILDKLLELIEKLFGITIDKTLKNSILEKQKSIFNSKQRKQSNTKKTNIKQSKPIEPTLFHDEESSTEENNNSVSEDTISEKEVSSTDSSTNEESNSKEVINNNTDETTETLKNENVPEGYIENNNDFEDIDDDFEMNTKLTSKNVGTQSIKYNKEEQEILKNAKRNDNGQLLAPNGKISNLTEKQYIQVRTKSFKFWFGDWENVNNILANINQIDTNLVDIEEHNKPWKNNPNKFNKSLRIYLKDHSKGYFELVKDEEFAMYSVHFKTAKEGANFNSDVKFSTKEERKILFKTLVKLIPEGAEVSTHGSLSDEGIIGLNNVGRNMTKIGERSAYNKSDNSEIKIPIYRKGIGVSKVIDENGEPKVVYHGSKSGNIQEFNPTLNKNRQYLSKKINPINFFTDEKSVADFFAISENQILASNISFGISRVLDALGNDKSISKEELDNYVWSECARLTGKSKEFCKDFWENKVPEEYKINDEYGNTIMKDDNIVNYKYNVFLNLKNPYILNANGEKADTFIINNQDIINNNDEIIIKNINETVGDKFIITDYLVRNPNQIKSADKNNGDFLTTNNNIYATKVTSENIGNKSIIAKEQSINNYNDNNRETNPNGYTPIKNIDDFVAQYPTEMQPIINKMIGNGAIEVLCA